MPENFFYFYMPRGTQEMYLRLNPKNEQTSPLYEDIQNCCPKSSILMRTLDCGGQIIGNY